MTFFYPHQGSTPCRISHGSSWWNHCQKSEMLWGQQLPEKNTPASHWRTGQDIYIYVLYYLYIYIRMYIAYIMYMIYIVATLSQKRHLSVSSQNPQWRRTVRRRWGLGQNDHRDVDHLGLFESQNGARLSIVMWNLWRICILYKYMSYMYICI